jgi:hypothetical protein
MYKIMFAGIAALAAIAVVWSVSTLAKPKFGTEASAPMAPHEIMVKQGNSLPVEYWAHPF